MAIAARFRHELVVEVYTPGTTTDARGHTSTTATWVDGPAFHGLIQERKAREIPTGDLAGVAISDATAFVPIGTAVRSVDRIRRLDTGARYAILGEPRDAGARGRHLELDARRLTP